jgi:transcription termination factor Rho
MTLDRAVLEAKSRDELSQIATALQIKPPSRARKSDLVDLIIGHAVDGTDNGAGGTPPAAGNGDTPDRAETATGAAEAPAADAVASPTAGVGVDAAASVTRVRTRRAAFEGTSQDDERDATTADDPAAADAGAGADASARGGEAVEAPGGGSTVASAATTESAGSPEPEIARAGTDGGSEARADRSRADRNRTDGDGPERAGGEQVEAADSGGERASAADADRSGEEARRDDGEGDAGNRRRRRRGRDRDRDRERDQREPAEPEGEPVEVDGILELRDEGYGFLRTRGFLPTKEDVYLSAKLVRQLGLRKGDLIKGMSRPANRSEKNPALLRVDLVNGKDPEEARQRRRFEDLTPLFPDEKLRLELASDPANMTARIIDLISPIGKGQRGLIVSPPKAGKTTIMKQIAQSIEANNPEVHLIVLLVDERPEEVTDMRRSVKGDVIASTFDRPSDEHTHVAELTIERAKRLVEEGRDVVIILDGITRLARAYNLAAPATGRIMSGGIDAGALYPPKKFFGAARNVEEGGSLTILATALVETGSRMDEHIFEEFKGTGNMELRLDRRLAERRIFPAIDVDASSTRHEELLFERRQLQQVWKLRRVLSGLSGGDGEGRAGAGLELLLDRLRTFRSNDEFLNEIAKSPSM